MNIKWFVTFIAINVVSCMKSIQKIPQRYNTPSTNPDQTLTLPSDKNSFPDVIYPTSILDIANPFYFNTDNNYEVLGPFSEDVKSSYKLLSSIAKTANNYSERNVKYLTEINEIVTTPAIDAVANESVEENITECHNDNEEVCVNLNVLDEAIDTNAILNNTAQNYDYYNVSLPREVLNESCSKIPLLVKISIQVFKERSDKNGEVIGIVNNLSSQDNEENNTHLKPVTETSGNESSEETNSSSEEHYTELQDINHSDFIKMLSVSLLDLLVSTENATSEMWNTTLIENEVSERIVLESFDNLTNSECLGLMESELIDLEPFSLMESELTDLEPFGLMESELTDLEPFGLMESKLNVSEPFDLMESDLIDSTTNITHSDLESMLNFTEEFEHTEEFIKNSKEDYFLELLVSLDSLCNNNNTVETVTDSEYLTNNEYLHSENFTII